MTGIVGRDDGTVGTSPFATLEGEGATEGTGGEKVETKDGTSKFGLPCNEATVPVIEAGTGGNPFQKRPKPKLEFAGVTRTLRERPQLFQPCLEKAERSSIKVVRPRVPVLRP